MLESLVEAGLQRIQVTSFVHPKWVPQMADAEEIVQHLPDKAGVIYTGLALNSRGVDRAAKAGLSYVDLSISTNNQHSKDNANMSRDAANLAGAGNGCPRKITSACRHRWAFQCVFGYKSPGDTPLQLILDMTDQFVSQGIESLSLADSTGIGKPTSHKTNGRSGCGKSR